MPFTAQLDLPGPYSTGVPFEFRYTARNTGQHEEPGHMDRIVVSQPFAESRVVMASAPATAPGHHYENWVPVEGLPQGSWDISVEAPEGHVAGTGAIWVQSWA